MNYFSGKNRIFPRISDYVVFIHKVSINALQIVKGKSIKSHDKRREIWEIIRLHQKF